MKYVVSGYIGFDNFGDEAIAHVLSQKLKKSGAEKVTLISSNPERTSELHGVCSCGMLKFLPSLLEADVLISGGGSLLQDVTSIKSLIYYLAVIYSALILGKKVEIFAQGIGPINSSFGRFLTKFALKRAYKITVRDRKSQELLNSWNIKSELVKDPVFDIELSPKNRKGTVGVQLRSFNGVDETFLNKLADSISQQCSDKNIQIISLQDKLDLPICEQFAQILRNRGMENVEVKKQLSVNDATETISNLEYLVAMRFHANVIGIKSGVKTLAINYDPKVERLAEEYNLPMINMQDSDYSEPFERLFN